MLSHLFSRSVRCAAAALAVLALVVTLAAPVQAAPLHEAPNTGPLAALMDWLVQWLGPDDLVVSSPDRSPARETISRSNGQCMDPNGNPIPCTEDD